MFYLGIKGKERGDGSLALKDCIISSSLACPPPITLRRREVLFLNMS